MCGFIVFNKVLKILFIKADNCNYQPKITYFFVFLCYTLSVIY